MAIWKRSMQIPISMAVVQSMELHVLHDVLSNGMDVLHAVDVHVLHDA